MNSKKITSNMVSLMSKQSLKSNRMRNIFVMLAIFLASALLMAILAFAGGQEQQAKNILSHGYQAAYYNLTNEQMETLEKDKRISFQVHVKTGRLSKMEGFDIMPYYVNRLSGEIQIAELESGSLPEKENEIAVQAAMLEKMGIKPRTGRNVDLTFYDGSTENFTISGILKGSSTAKQFPVFFSASYAVNGSQLKDMPYEVYAKLDNAANMNAEDFKETVYLIGSDAGISRKYISLSKAFTSSLSASTQTIMLYGVAGAVILFACALVIYGVFYLSVTSRIHEFGQLCAVGMTKKQMKKFVLCEGSILYFRSASAGILTGGIAGYFIIPDGFNITNTFIAAVLVFVFVYIITMVSMRKPAMAAASVSPARAMRYMPQDDMKKTVRRKMCRNLSPFGLGLVNFLRNPKKTLITFASLSFGGILFITAAAYMSSFDKDSYARQGYFADAEFHVGYSGTAIELSENGMGGIQASVPLGSRMVQKIASWDGVKKVEEIKSFGVSFDYPANDEYGNNDVVYPMSEEETKEAGKYLESGSAGYSELSSGNYVLVADNNNAEEIYGWKFAVGDSIILHYYDGSRMAEKEVKVLGILGSQYLLNNQYLEGWFLMPEKVISGMVSYKSLNAHLLVSSEEDNEEEVGENLAELLGNKTELSLETLSGRREAYEQTANQMQVAVSGFAVFIMMFSILSMANTLVTNIVARKHELAVLQSAGMAKSQVCRMLICESMLLVLATIGVTMAAGVLSGYILCNILYSKGAFYMEFRFPAVFAFAYSGVLIIVPLAIIFISMKSFIKKPLVERLRETRD